MAQDLRKTGIDVIGDVSWGTHLCQFYKTEKDLGDLLVPFFKAGLENNEFCMWVTYDPIGEKDAERLLRRVVPDLDACIAEGRLEIVPHDDWYLHDGVFDLARVFKGWFDKLERALERGLEGLRASGNTAWLETGTWADFRDYEKELNRIIGDKKMIALCTYSLDKCGASEVLDVLENHQMAIAKREGDWVVLESSESKKADLERRKLNEELLRINKELDGYARSVSHDLRTPLSAALMASEMLMESSGTHQLKDPADVSEFAGIIHRNIEKAFTLIDDLLALAEAGQVPAFVSVVDIEKTVERVLEEQAPLIREKHVTVKKSGVLGHVSGSPTHMYQLFSNLITNAIKHNDSSDPVVEVLYLGDDDGGAHRYLVRDNGSGIAEGDMGSIFLPFFKKGDDANTGVGLATVEKIINIYSGEIKVYNDGGACFEFTVRDHRGEIAPFQS